MIQVHAAHLLSGALLMSVLALASTAAAQCNEPADCRAGSVCKDGQCVAARCSTDAECADHGTCDGGACKAMAPPAAKAAPLEASRPLAPAPPGDLYRTERRLMPELYVVGPAMLAATWLTTIAVTAGVTPSHDVGRATAYAAIPVVGPWVMLGSGFNSMSYTPAVITSGIGQAAFLGMTLAGLTVRHDVKVPVVGTEGGVRVMFVPSAGGAAAIGTF